MIPINFDYYRPDTADEAVNIYKELSLKNKNPVYYSGGSEIISMSRAGSIAPGVVIDLKAIPECRTLELYDDNIIIGSCVTLSQIYESKKFLLLGSTCARIADHTNQCRITIGGNVCGTIIYRECVLPLLLTDCTVIITGESEKRQTKIGEIFNQRIKLNQGEFILGFSIDKRFLNLPYIHVKKTKNEKIDYPLISTAAILFENKIRMAFSGFANFPFRSIAAENIINDEKLSPQQRADKITNLISDIALNNISGSKNYRLFVLNNMVLDLISRFGEIKFGKV